MNLKPLELNQDFKYALNVLEKTNKSLFITGRAGTGKSTLLRLFKNTSRKKVVVLAPTGIAALNVNGQTIHSFCGFPPRFILPKDIKKRRFKKLYKSIEVVVIDEISMVRADVLDAVSQFLKINRDSHLPFGGVQMVFIGDLFQLPPVIGNDLEKTYFDLSYESPYFFSAKVFHQFEYEKLELGKVYRQEARFFLRLLEAVRLNKADWEDIEDLNERFQPDFEPEGDYITLSPRNFQVNQINDREMRHIDEVELTFMARIEGKFEAHQYPIDPILKLKIGTQVMFVKNDLETGKFVNGTIGKVTELSPEKIIVAVKEGNKTREVEVPQMEWEIIRYQLDDENPNELKSEVLGTFTQYPLKLAWAVTIHKSQGKTFDRVIIDMGKGAFEHGQTYVALSRCRTLEGIILTQKIQMRDILVDERIVEYYESNF